VAETFLGRFLVPAIFVVVEKLSGSKTITPGTDPLPSPAQGD
jgi:hypothetical protein